MNKLYDENWNVLTSFFPEGWEQMAFETGALVRRRKINDPETLLRLLLIHLAEGLSLRSTVTYASEANMCNINDTAFLHRFRASGEWLRWMAVRMRDDVELHVSARAFAADNRVRLIDGSVINEPGSTGTDWRLHYSMNLKSLHCDEFYITDYKKGETFKNFQIQSNDLLLGDRAYCNQNGITHVLNHGGNVLVRFHSTALPLSGYRRQRFNVLEHLRKLDETEVGDWNVYLFKKNGERIKGRLCAMRKSQEAAAKAKKNIKSDASKKQHSVKPETYEFAEYIVIFTTVNRHRLSKAAIMDLYRARWQVELSFKRLKGIMEVGHLPKNDPECCKAWLYGKMFVALLVERLIQEAESFSPWGYPVKRNKN